MLEKQPGNQAVCVGKVVGFERGLPCHGELNHVRRRRGIVEILRGDPAIHDAQKAGIVGKMICFHGCLSPVIRKVFDLLRLGLS